MTTMMMNQVQEEPLEMEKYTAAVAGQVVTLASDDRTAPDQLIMETENQITAQGT